MVDKVEYKKELLKSIPYQKIAVVGGIRSGKTSVRDILVSEFGFEVLSFGAKLKESLADVFQYVKDVEVKDVESLIKYGQSCRAIHPDVWISHVNESLKVCEKRSKEAPVFTGVVIDDLRQPNEYQWARENGFTIIRVQASEDIRFERAINVGDKITREDLRKETESHYNKFEVDKEFTNEGTYEEFKEDVIEYFTEEFDKIAEKIKEEKRDRTAKMIMLYPIFKSKAYAGHSVAMEISAVFTHAIEINLTDEEKKVITRLYVEQFTRSYVASELGISEWQVRKLRNEALDKLSNVLLEGDIEEWLTTS